MDTEAPGVTPHAGERLWLLGNGPSLNDWTPEEVRELGGRTLGINRSWQRFPQTDYHCLIAGAQLPALLEGHVRARVAFVPENHRWLFHDSKFKGEIYFVRHAGSYFGPSVFDGPRYAYVGAFTGLMALQLAAHMGFRQLVLLGFDCRSSDGHFHAPNIMSGRAHMVPRLLAAAMWLDSLGVEVLNANPGSAIPWWPRLTKAQLARQLKHQPCGAS